MDNGQHKLRSLERLLKEIDVVLELEYPQSLSKKYMDSVYFLRVFEAEISKYLKTYPNYLPLYLWEKNNDIVIDQAEEVAELQSVVSYHENLIDLEKKEYYKSYFIRFNDRVMNKRSK